MAELADAVPHLPGHDAWQLFDRMLGEDIDLP